MSFADENWLEVADAFNLASVGHCPWDEALSGLARASGSRIGELIGLGAERAMPFNWASEVGQQWVDELCAAEGHDPAVNPFVRHGAQAAPLQVLASGDYLDSRERAGNTFINTFCREWDLLHICQTPLIKQDDLLIGLAVLRSGSQGDIKADQRAVFASLAPQVRAAVRTQMALEQQGPALMAGALEALSLTAFICDRHGIVRAMTPNAERFLRSTSAIRLWRGNLRGCGSEQSRALNNAIGVAAEGLLQPGAPVSSALVIRDAAGAPLVLDVLSLPRRSFTLGFEARAVVVVAGSGSDPARMRGLLMQVYGLTDAEVDVALRLTDGHTPEQIAEARGAAIGTVRTQVRSIYSKLGVHRLNELMARIGVLR